MGIRIWFLTGKTLYIYIKKKVSTFFWGLHKCIWTIQHQSLNQIARLDMAFKNETDKGSQRIPLLLFCHEIMSDSLWPHRWQHTRLPCPSLSLRVCSASCPLSQWCHPTISSSVIRFSSCLQSFPASRSFFNKSVLCIRWPKYWSFSFSISPSNEYWRLISFRIDWFDLHANKQCPCQDTECSWPYMSHEKKKKQTNKNY